MRSSGREKEEDEEGASWFAACQDSLSQAYLMAAPYRYFLTDFTMRQLESLLVYAPSSVRKLG